MDRITINGSTSYDVVIEQNILNNVGTLLNSELGGNKALIVTDSNVAALYLDKVSNSLRAAGYAIESQVFTPGEETKNIDNYVSLLNFLSENEFVSVDLIIALGGGSVGDLAGFVASTYKRGTKFVQIPTTLLACVDSSVGGKSAINLPTGKNQVGTIKNPSIVICDPELIHTLSKDALLDGYAEIIKYGILDGYEIIDLLRESKLSNDYTSVISKAINIKKFYIEKDEFDANSRQFLNLGHLIGHAIEAASDYEISHGKAVAIGLVFESKCCTAPGLCENDTATEIMSLVNEFGFKSNRTFTLDELFPYILRDKRIRDDQIDIIVSYSVGNCELHKLPASELFDYLKAGL